MKWILFIMLFVTPAKNVTKEEIDDTNYPTLFEKHRLWTLQSTSTMEFSSLDGCFNMEAELLESVSSVHVANLTSRVWCACDSADNKCPNANEIKNKIQELSKARAQVKSRRLTPEGRALNSGTPPSSFAIQRMFPPED